MMKVVIAKMINRHVRDEMNVRRTTVDDVL